MKSRWLLFLLPLACFALSSCGTTTRLGDVLIPAHPNSYARSGEKVEIIIKEVCKQEKQKKSVTVEAAKNGVATLSGAGGVIAAFLAEQAVEFAIDEIKGESKKYQAQYGHKVRQSFRFDKKYTLTLRRTLPIEDSDEKFIASEFVFDLNFSKFNKTLALVELDLKSVKVNRAKAKVVGLSAKPWTWLGAALFNTGNQVKVDIQAIARGITSKGVVTILDSKYPSSGQKLNLSGDAHNHDFPPGEYAITGHTGEEIPMTLEFVVTESDPSNVKKLLDDAAESAEEKKGSILDIFN